MIGSPGSKLWENGHANLESDGTAWIAFYSVEMPHIGLIGNGLIAQLVDYQELLGTMIFPFDAGKRRDFVLQLVEAIRKEPPRGKVAHQKWYSQMSRFAESAISLSELDHILFSSLPPQLNLAKSLREESLANFGKGLVAGQILLMLIQLADGAPEHATLNKARHLVSAKLRKKALASNGEAKIDVPFSPRSIENIWAQFKPVCHLYAAFIETRAEHARDSRSGELSRETMHKLLAIAEAYRRRGQEHQSLGSLEPTLDENQMWTVPANIALKDIEFSFRPVRISKADLAELNKYKHD